MTQPKKSIQSLKPYINGKNTGRLFSRSARVMKLDSNESSLPPSSGVTAALAEFIQHSLLNWYPDIQAKKLVDKLSDYTACRPEFIQTFNGSDNGLETICKTFLEPGDEVVLCVPTYDHFRVYAESCDGILKPVFGKDSEEKTKKILALITPKTKIVYIVNPTMTGMVYSQKQIERLLKGAPHALILVDEAYFEFCGITMIDLVRHHPNLIVSRSFSKALGLAGLRLGYLISSPSLLEPINKVRIGKINSLTQVAACAALDDREYVERYVFEMNAAKKWLSEKLDGAGLEVIDSKVNYLLVKVSQPQKVVAWLEKNDIFVRAHIPYLPSFLRITVGHQLLMERFWKIFRKVPPAYLSDEGEADIKQENVLSTIQT